MTTGTRQHKVAVNRAAAAADRAATVSFAADDGHDNNWTTGADWSTGRAPTSLNDVIIVTDQSRPGTPAYPATITTGTNATARSVLLNDIICALETENIPPVLSRMNSGDAAVTLSRS